jgi:tetratricopeptide (TPR) repeat protein
MVAEQARPLLKPGEKVFARKPHFAWYAGLTATAFPFADSLLQLADAARRDGVRWLYFSWPEAEMRPQFMYLLDTTSAVPGLTARVVTKDHPAVLYEIGPGFGANPSWVGDPWEVAVHRARAMVAINLADWRSRLVVANDEQRHDRWDNAQPLLEGALRRAPDNPEVILMLADNLVHLRRYAEASDFYARAERIQPGNPRTRIGAGWVALLSGQVQQAAELWRPMGSYADDPGTLERMAELFDSVHDADAAAQARVRMRMLGIAETAR